MLKHLTPKTIRAPFARYSHGVEIAAGARILFASGQLGIAPDERIPDDAGGQTELCFDNARRVLEASGMDFADVVRINAYVTDRAYLPAYMAVRDRLFGDPPPASTLMIVSGFAREIFKVEVELIAARKDD